MTHSLTPRVFVSAASSDLKSARKVVNDALTRIECLPVEQSLLGTEYGPVREMLARKIESCQAVIHLVGRDYGGEPDPATVPASQPRRSWTQIEYDLAKEQNRKLYLIVCDASFPFDPVSPPEPADKIALQLAHHQAVLADANLRYTVQTDGELRQAIEDMKLPLEEVRAELVRQQKRHRIMTISVTLAIIALLVGGIYGFSRLGRQVDVAQQETIRQLSDPVALGESIRKQIRTSAETKISALPVEPGRWQKVAAIEQERDAALGRVEDLLKLIQEGLKEGASPIFQRATEILQKEGIDAAIAYLESRRSNSLETARLHSERAEAEKEQRNRALKPLLLEAELRETRFEWKPALQLREQVAQLAPDWFDARNNLGWLLHHLARYREAESHCRAALALAISAADQGVALNNLASLLMDSNGLAEAEPLLRRALAINEKFYGAQDPQVAINLSNLGRLLQATNRLAQAEPLMRRALAIDQQYSGTEDSSVAVGLFTFAEFLQATNRLAEAEPLWREALGIFERCDGTKHPDVAHSLNSLAMLLEATNRVAEAEPLIRRALVIDELAYGAGHPEVARDLNNLAQLLQATNRLAEAEALMRRSLAIDEQSLGTEHTDIAICLDNLAQLLQATKRLAEAEPLFRRAVAIDEQSYGTEHPNVAIRLNNLATLLHATNRLAQAEPLMKRSLSIFGQFGRRTNHVHPSFQTMVSNYRRLLEELKIPSDEIAQRMKDTTEDVRTLQAMAPEVERLLGPARPVADVLAELDRQYKAEGKPAIYFLPADQPISPRLDELLGPSMLDVPLNEPIVPHLEKLLGPAKSTAEVFEVLDRQYREQNKPAIWFLPLSEPISPHLDELLGPLPAEQR